jgi:hypothetical protein
VYRATSAGVRSFLLRTRHPTSVSGSILVGTAREAEPPEPENDMDDVRSPDDLDPHERTRELAAILVAGYRRMNAARRASEAVAEPPQKTLRGPRAIRLGVPQTQSD